MKWGRRKARDKPSYDKSVKVAGTPAPRASEDAKRTGSYQARVKAGGTSALSTKELQELVTRQNLEAQYSRLNPAPVSAGQKIMENLLPVVGAAYNAQREARSAHPDFQPKEEPISTALALPRSKKKMMADIVVATGKQVIAEQGLDIGIALAKSLLLK
ncbi:hypothetical protein SEA_SLOOPYJOE_7 [Arthrobacter phage Sloopyjoe]|nr:hypothetical protein PBI_STAYER_7 [Arthrobacter phage Stayer]QFG09716.1 hypothetical protein PBI_SHIBA_7 [Arthrobacter phage Shiba]QFG10151.1 hypothetical protein PBI_EGAD_7 [Arthrobacter phage Egad]QFG11721.1 hypothetical protein PBI_SALK_7 [Arthrobacter phage Salk]QFG12604.1 hypothetical protein PBI_MICHELLE_7 [Arthrobacter phage Michelle]QFG14377.1 hypothetical protein PBI_STARLORD_7 [Arthrobacter phage StarLord]UVT31085.1 hypothetical protein PBI_LINDA_7 [Arthrobacter phage Linda]WAB0